MTLRDRTISGLGWFGAAKGVEIVFSFLVTIVLARMLTPDDFGIVAMAFVVIEFAAIFGDMGVSSALIQKQDATQQHYSSSFWLNILVAVGLMGLLIFLAPYIAAFYHAPRLKNVLIVLSVNFVLVALTIVQQAILRKELEFRRLAIRSIFGGILSGVLSIWCAWSGWGVWSIVAQTLVYSVFNIFLLWGVSSWRPRFIFSWPHIAEMLPFSMNMMGASMVSYLARNVDKILIGRFLGSEALGFYSVAYKLMMYAIHHISWVVHDVMFPAYARLQSDLDRLRSVYARVLKGIALAAFPLCMALFVMAPEVIRVIYGEKWISTVPLIGIMCWGGMFMAVGGTSYIVYQSIGRADINLWCNILNIIFTVASIGFGIQFGLQGVAMAYTLYIIAWNHVLFYIASKVLKVSYASLYSNLVPALLLSALMCVIMRITGSVFAYSGLASLLVMSATGLLVYGGLMFRSRYLLFTDGKLKINI